MVPRDGRTEGDGLNVSGSRLRLTIDGTDG